MVLYFVKNTVGISTFLTVYKSYHNCLLTYSKMNKYIGYGTHKFQLLTSATV